MHLRKLWTLVLPLILAGSGCHEVPVTGRSAVNLVSDEHVTKLSIEEFEKIKSSQRLSRNRAHIAIVNRVGQRLSQAAFWDMPLADWEFVVFEAPGVVNAFAMPGGKVGVFSGLLEMVENEDQLASVLAHEIAHVTARHTHERYSQSGLLGGANIASAVAVGMSVPGIYISGSPLSGVSNLAQLSFDRGKEKEADHIGLIYMARAGYNPREALKFLEKMESMTAASAGPPAWLSTHPAFPDRQLQLIDLMPQALAEHEKSGQQAAKRVVE